MWSGQPLAWRKASTVASALSVWIGSLGVGSGSPEGIVVESGGVRMGWLDQVQGTSKAGRVFPLAKCMCQERSYHGIQGGGGA